MAFKSFHVLQGCSRFRLAYCIYVHCVVDDYSAAEKALEMMAKSCLRVFESLNSRIFKFKVKYLNDTFYKFDYPQQDVVFIK